MKKFYKIIRSLLAGTLLTIAGLYALLYIALLLPPVQRWICGIASEELTARTGGKVEIGGVSIFPFNEVILSDVQVCDPAGHTVMKADKIGAGLSLQTLLRERRLVFTYAEIIALDAHISQPAPGAPLNIQYLIDAFKSREKNKPPTRFDLVINNIILRNCSLTYDREWIQPKPGRVMDFNHLTLTDISADLRLPVMRNDDFSIDLRRLAFRETSGLKVNKIAGKFHISSRLVAFSGLSIEMPGTVIRPSDMELDIDGFAHLKDQLLSRPLTVILPDTRITPSDFACLLPALSHYNQQVRLNADITYHRGNLAVDRLEIDYPAGISLRAHGEVNGLEGDIKNLSAAFPALKLMAKASAVSAILDDFVTLKPEAAALLRRLGDIQIDAAISGSAHNAEFDGKIIVSPGEATLSAAYHALQSGRHQIKAAVSTSGFDVGMLLDKPDFGRLITTAEADLTVAGGDADGHISVDVGGFVYKGYNYAGLIADITKRGKSVEGEIAASDPNLDFELRGSGTLAGAASDVDLTAQIRNVNLTALKLPLPVDNLAVSGDIKASFTGNSPDNADGFIEVTGLHYSDSRHPDINLDHLYLQSQRHELPYSLTLESEFVSASVRGDFYPTQLPASLRTLAARFLPDLVTLGHTSVRDQQFEFEIDLPKDSPLLSGVKLPVSLLEDLRLTGSYDSSAGTAALDLDIPYLRQGKSKLIRDTRLALRVDTATDLCNLAFATRIPNNKGDITVSLDANTANNRVQTDLSWVFDRARSYRGLVSLTAMFPRDADTGRRDIEVYVNPSQFEVNDTVWQIDPARILYHDKSVQADSIKVHRPGQYAVINGKATASPDDRLTVDLRNIDLDYVFETLNINYVTFGGRASGTVEASRLFSGLPVLQTSGLKVDNLTYNRSLLGDALIDSHWDNDTKSVYLDADISEKNRRVARIYGNIYVVGESLDLTCEADKVDIGFLQPFMAAFSSAVEGRASGNVHLYGTFKDIDLTGKVFADTLRMKVDVTNTWYSASDTVIMEPGLIKLDDITLRDRNGHTAVLNGEVRHRYFHDPSFDFSVTKARDFLCYDTNAAINPVWYGTIYGNGSGSIHGVPGYISVLVDMTSAPGSSFTFVLDDSEEAETYQFLTFTDKRKEALEASIREQVKVTEEEPEFLKEFRRQEAEKTPDRPTRYSMDIRMTATPDANVTIVMDPVAGDKIKANGSGNLRMSYNNDGEMDLYGTYTLTRGTYNFTLQDVIVRDFKIRDGSKITFNGDPLAAVLDITAAYRVNTSLTDLDKSFASDRELNRTNVPVEALLKVSGNMQSPDINFDIELPTLTQDITRKVKSIVSTSDMMSRQIVYLLALNRFYTPDYMGTTGNNNELGSLASTTLSTQLTSMLGALSPNWSFTPNFRTDKGDFSDMEVDLALSSTLLNNRLLLNGNFGYRDRATSSTTFVGDFDIEYLLNSSGSLRLKAYNHFNDQNYYLRSALTTQGIGIVFKRDFNHFLPGLFRRRKKTSTPDTIPAVTTDTIR
ncbi:MAG: translocation/assembly module TamB domain-containing protein [Muribaculaceae bacterium]|nr:translocation/assembly module TamB domain-containing protein [Muribaculaceae bacterium]